MATLIHLADANNAERIKQGGIKTGKLLRSVYCMPVLPDFYASHQWLRELKASGVKTLVAVYFKVEDESEMVYIRKLGGSHRRMPLSDAIKEIWESEIKEGYELLLERKVEAKDIIRIKALPQNIGWRYAPDSHGTTPCNCEYCLHGRIKGRRAKRRLDEKEE